MKKERQTKKDSDKLIVRHLLRTLHMQEREYRKALSELRGHLNVIEKAMSAKDYAAIDMEKLSSRQQLELKLAAPRYDAVEEAVRRGLEKEAA